MREWLIVLLLLLVGCQESEKGRVRPLEKPPEDFDENYLYIDKQQRSVSYVMPDNPQPLILDMLTTYEQVSYLRRNAYWIDTYIDDWRVPSTAIENQGSEVESGERLFVLSLILNDSDDETWLHYALDITNITLKTGDAIIAKKTLAEFNLMNRLVCFLCNL